MNRRRFVSAASAVAGNVVVKIRGNSQNQYRERTIHETAAERLSVLLRYIPNTEEYQQLVQNAQWADIEKQLDAFGLLKDPDQITGRAVMSQMFAIGDNVFPSAISSTEIAAEYFFPMLTLRQGIRLPGKKSGDPFLRILIGPDPFAFTSTLREKGYTQTVFSGGIAFAHPEPALEKYIFADHNQYILLLDDGAVVYLNSEREVSDYVTWLEEQGSTILESEQFQLMTIQLPRDSTYIRWVDGYFHELDWTEQRYKWMNQFGYSETQAEEIVQRLKEPFDKQEQLLGLMPQALSFRIGYDAGMIPAGPLDSDPRLWLATGYEEPDGFFQAVFTGNEEALRAADIIDWRWYNSPSWTNPGILYGDTYPLSPIHRSGIAGGVLMQKPVSITSPIQEMMVKEEPAIYGWWFD